MATNSTSLARSIDIEIQHNRQGWNHFLCKLRCIAYTMQKNAAPNPTSCTCVLHFYPAIISNVSQLESSLSQAQPPGSGTFQSKPKQCCLFDTRTHNTHNAASNLGARERQATNQTRPGPQISRAVPHSPARPRRPYPKIGSLALSSARIVIQLL